MVNNKTSHKCGLDEMGLHWHESSEGTVAQLRAVGHGIGIWVVCPGAGGTLGVGEIPKAWWRVLRRRPDPKPC